MKLFRFMRSILAGLAIALILACGGGTGSDDDSDDSTDADFDENVEEDVEEVISSVSFNLAGAIGVAIDNSPNLSALAADVDGADVDETDAASSNLRRVNPDSSLSDAVTSGSVQVDQFMVAAGNQVYLLLSSPVDSCRLIRVDGETNEATCVDATLSSIDWENAYGPPIQFDAAGNIYYTGEASEGNTILRRNDGETITDLINDYIGLSGFLVLSDGNTIISGTTSSTGSDWTRIVTPAGSLKSLLSYAPNLLARFPDNNVYMKNEYGNRIDRYLTATEEFDPIKWIGNSSDSEKHYYTCPSNDCSFGFGNSRILRTTDAKVYFKADQLLQLYPVVSNAVTTVSQVTIAKGILNHIILAGFDSDNQNKLVLYDTKSDTETDLLGSEDIEVYHLSYLNANDHQIVMFDGLRFSDNQYVLCQVDLTDNNALTCSETGTGKLTDLQLFDEAEMIPGGGTNDTKTYTIGGEVEGLQGTLVLENEANGDTLTLTGNGPFDFPLTVASAYNVVVKTQPEGQTCTVSGGSGTVADDGVTSVSVVCSTNPGVIITFAGGGGARPGDDGAATLASLVWPSDVVFDGSGNLYFSESSRIRKVDTDGIITTVAGTGTSGFSGDGGPATDARLNYTGEIAIDSSGNLFIADMENHRIRKVDTDGIITTIAGTGAGGFSGDGGPATSAKLSQPKGVATDGLGNIYFADSGNRRIRMIDSSGAISTIAGNGSYDFAGDGGLAVEAALNSPAGIAFDSLGNLYIADRDNHRIRKVDTEGIITTVAGDGSRDFSGDGGLAVEAALNQPEGVALDAFDNLYIADSGNSRIRMVSGE